MCVFNYDRVAPGQCVRDAVLATVTQCLVGRKEKSLPRACGQEKCEPLSHKLEPNAHWPIPRKGQFYPRRGCPVQLALYSGLPYLIPTATPRGRPGYYSHLMAEGTAAQGGEETGQKSHRWKQESLYLNPNPLKPKAFLCHCCVTVTSLL